MWLLLRSHRTELFGLVDLYSRDGPEMVCYSVVTVGRVTALLLLRSPGTVL